MKLQLQLIEEAAISRYRRGRLYHPWLSTYQESVFSQNIIFKLEQAKIYIFWLWSEKQQFSLRIYNGYTFLHHASLSSYIFEKVAMIKTLLVELLYDNLLRIKLVLKQFIFVLQEINLLLHLNYLIFKCSFLQLERFFFSCNHISNTLGSYNQIVLVLDGLQSSYFCSHALDQLLLGQLLLAQVYGYSRCPISDRDQECKLRRCFQLEIVISLIEEFIELAIVLKQY